MFGVDSILGSSKNAEVEDYYKLFNCDENSTIDQINAEFKILALESHPDKNAGNPEALFKFQTLQEARNVLTDPKLRRDYDKWRGSEVAMTFKQWLALGSRCQPTMHWAKPRTQTMIEPAAAAVAEPKSVELNEANDLIKIERFGNPAIKEGWKAEQSNIYQQFRNYRI